MKPLLSLLFFAALISGGCAGSRNFHPLDESAASAAPRFLELRRSAQSATLHFPAGIYVLTAEDDAGFFYQAPQKIVENSFSGPLRHEGGVYLQKSRRGHLRGYVYWYGGLVHVGDLSRAEYVLRD